MTKEQTIGFILTDMQPHLDEMQLSILKETLVNRFEMLGESNELATYENSNEQFFKLFMALKGARLSDKTMKIYAATLKNFIQEINKPLNQVTSLDIEYYLNLKRKTNSEVSLNNYRRNLSAFFTWMRKKRYMEYNPCEEVEAYKEIKKPIDHLEATDMEQLRNGCTTDRDRALIEFMSCTAVRVGELITVKISDIDFTSGRTLVYGHKSKKYRYVCLDQIALGYIQRYIETRGIDVNSDEYLFVSERGGGCLSEDGIREALKKIGKNAAMNRPIYPHLLRKTAATAIARHGGTVEEAGRYLGHAEQTVTGQHYVFQDDSATKAIFDKYLART